MHNFQFVWKTVSQLKLWVIVTFILMVLESQSYLVSVVLQQKLIDDVILSREFHYFWKIFILIAAAYIVHSVFITVSSVMMYQTVVRTRSLLSKKFMSCLHLMPVKQLENQHSSKFLYQLGADEGDIGSISNMIAGDIPRICRLIVLLVSLIFVLWNNPLMLGLLFVVSLLYVISAHLLGPRLKSASSRVNEARSNMLVHLEEGISSTREVAAFHYEKWEKKDYLNRFAEYFQSILHEGRMVNRQIISNQLLKWCAILAVLSVGGYLVLIQQLSIGMFIVTYQLALELIDKTNELYVRSMGLPARMASVERLRKVLESDKIQVDGARIEDHIYEVRLEQVSYCHAERETNILNDISLNIPLGKKIAVIGQSGSGKSTLASLLMRFYEPNTGRIVVNGLALSDVNRFDWLKRISLVPQNPYFFPDTIRANILLGMENSMDKLIKACKVAQIHDYISQLPNGYDTVIGDRGVTLSGGQKQRIAIARTLVREPELLILDESTSALDVETEKRLLNHLDQIRVGKTTIMITHRLSTIKDADHIFEFKQGEMVERVGYEEYEEA
ncbi:ABC transporter ATP-binding protein [Paenibacillus faecalis]|uniref:ABC transporter ATP-binding protein n=1 Tax=Paenibacillus faecalis TaxID=2079532 RepID=UPI000D1108CB|nr:ABC transporter ATP-binding protein [Paenibacillus faecalis]